VQVEHAGRAATLKIRPLEAADVPWAEGLLGAGFGGRLQARLGSLVDPLACPGFVAELDDRPVGVVTYQHDGKDAEIVYLETGTKHAGVGTKLVEKVAEAVGAARLWVVTTNDNLDALRFYQRRGFRISALHPGGVDEARRSLKPTIPTVGRFGIPIHDEIVLELRQGE
jgi:ribosomal protein S18 acetylase RimI-like enzyme